MASKEGAKDLSGRVAFVTGGARNIGLAIARLLAGRGASVALVDICRDLETLPYHLARPVDLKRAVEELSGAGTKVTGVRCDIRREREVRSAVDRVVDTLGPVDILVNNAGAVSLCPTVDLSEKAWDEVVDVCLKGTYLCCKHVLPWMIRKHYGKIVNLSSVAGLRGLGLSSHYCAAKHGVIGLTKALAMETADHHITVNAVCPGTVESESLKGLAAQAKVQGSAYEHFSLGHLVKDRRIAAEDIANAVGWLVSEQSRFVTGAVVTVDSGWSARG